MFSIRKSLQCNVALSIESCMKIFDHIVKPTLLYGSEVWGCYLYKVGNDTTVTHLLKDTVSLVEKLHSKFCKQILGLPKNSSNIGVRAELGRYPLLINIISRIINYYTDILNRPGGA